MIRRGRLRGGCLALLLAGCAGERARPAEPDPTPPGDPGPEVDLAECRREGVELRITPPDERDRATGDVATLHASFAGGGAGARAESVCLVEGDQHRLIRGGLTRQIRADTSRLQRIRVDDRPVLVHVPPGETLRIRPHSCVGWILVADWLDDGAMTSGRTTYREEGAACPDGFTDGGRVLEADDPRCGGVDDCEWERCVRAATLRFAGAEQESVALHPDAGASTPGEPLGNEPRVVAPYGGMCPMFAVVATPDERVRIAPGVGEDWLLTREDSGVLQGRILEAP